MGNGRAVIIPAYAACTLNRPDAGTPDGTNDTAARDGRPSPGCHRGVSRGVTGLTLHHMHPLGTALDRVSHLLRPGGTLILDEYAWDWADDATIRWFYDTAAILAAAEVIDPPACGDQLPARWRTRHTVDGARCNGGDAMLKAVSARLGNVTVRRVPYLARHLLAGGGSQKILAELCRIEREHLADGTLQATGFRLTATRHVTCQPPQPRPHQAPCPPR